MIGSSMLVSEKIIQLCGSIYGNHASWALRLRASIRTWTRLFLSSSNLTIYLPVKDSGIVVPMLRFHNTYK